MENSTMDNFCGSRFWDTNLTWNTDDSPDLTPCFQNTVLIWTPCLFLWTFTLLEACYLMKSKRRNIPWTWQLTSKCLLTIVLVVLSLTDLGMAIYDSFDKSVSYVEYFTPFIKTITFTLAGVILYYNKKFGMRTSGLLFLFWFLLALCGAIRLRTILMGWDEESEDRYSNISYLIYYSVVLLMFVLQFVAEGPPKFSEYPEFKRTCPEQAASFPSRIFFTWFDPLAWKGYNKPLEPTDLWSLNPDDTASEVFPKFDKYWKKKLGNSGPFNDTESSSQRTIQLADLEDKKNKKTVASIMIPLCKAFGGTFIFGAILKLIQDLMIFINPKVLELLIVFVGSPEEPMWKGYLYAIVLLMSTVVHSLVLFQYEFRMSIVGMRIRTALVAAIYRKALKMSNAARKEATVGEIVNLMSVDAQRFVELTPYVNTIWSAPLQIALALYFLWDILGPSALAGLVVIIIMMPVNGLIAEKMRTLQIKQMMNKDERVKVLNEVLNGIKVLKLYAWESSFEKRILKIRRKEVNILKEISYLYAGTTFIWFFAPCLVSLASFATFVLVDDNNVLDSRIAFKALSLFGTMQFPLTMLPLMISSMVQAGVSVKRLNAFMNNEELDPNNVQHDEHESDPLIIENGNFSWESETMEKPTLRNIDLRISEGQLVAVVGTVGSGKSSLVSAFLGEMDRISGRVNTKGSIAYVSQQAWIQNATMQNNILFGKKLDKVFYSKVVGACALAIDLKMLPAGDQTEIGEKGINLSGGQKQRVALARAVYNDSDVYFLDDPLSAVDSHVGKHIFESVVGPNGLLRKKTRVFVTHGITYLPEVDNIVVLKDGEITETGTYKQLLEKRGAFADFLIQHLREAVRPDEEETDLAEIKQQLQSVIGSDALQEKLEKALSSDSVTHNNDSESIGDHQSETGSLKRRQSNVVQPMVGQNLIEVEKTETGSVKLEVYAHYFKSVGWTFTIASIFMNIFYQLFSVSTNVWLGKWSDDNQTYVDSHIDENRRATFIGVYAALGLGQGFSAYMMSVVFASGAISASRHIFEGLLKRVLRAPGSFFDTTPSGRILNRFGKDTDVVDNTLPMALRVLSNCLFGVIGILMVISYSTPAFMIIIIPIGVIYYFIQRFYVATSRQLKRLESVSRSPIYSHFSESIAGAQTIRAYDVSQRFIRESEDKIDSNQACYYPSIISDKWLGIRSEMVGDVIIFSSALFAVLGRDTLSPGIVGLSVTYALQILETLNWLVRMTSDVETDIVAVERIKEYGETPQEAPWEIASTTPPKSWPEQGRVEFRDFKVRYREGLELVLKGVSFTINGSEKVGIVGRTGAGKSSLTLGLFRFIEAADGKIFIDGIDISKLGLHALRSRLTIIPQDPVLFSGSMRLNLDPFETHKDEEIWRALENAHLKAFVKSLPNGLHHEVSEGGDNLSVGQRQLICLARALLRKTKILILDEATAAVDLETDDLIQRTIREEFKDCTVLTIAHRLNTIIDSDRVIVLDKGYLTEFENPQVLLQKPTSAFYSMAKDAGLVA